MLTALLPTLLKLNKDKKHNSRYEIREPSALSDFVKVRGSVEVSSFLKMGAMSLGALLLWYSHASQSSRKRRLDPQCGEEELGDTYERLGYFENLKRQRALQIARSKIVRQYNPTPSLPGALFHSQIAYDIHFLNDKAVEALRAPPLKKKRRRRRSKRKKVD